MKYYNRHSIRLKDFDYSQPGYYYITICTHLMKPILSKIENGKMILNDSGNIANNEWINTSNIRPNVEMDYYVIMPNHIHGIIIINRRNESKFAPKDKFQSPSQTLGAILRGYKSTVTKKINILRNAPNETVWQRNYYERVIRNEKELHNIRNYIVQNPLKWEFEKNIPDNLDII